MRRRSPRRRRLGLSRLTGRLLTGRLAFFVAFVLDVIVYWASRITRRTPGR